MYRYVVTARKGQWDGWERRIHEKRGNGPRGPHTSERNEAAVRTWHLKARMRTATGKVGRGRGTGGKAHREGAAHARWQTERSPIEEELVTYLKKKWRTSSNVPHANHELKRILPSVLTPGPVVIPATWQLFGSAGMYCIRFPPSAEVARRIPLNG
ncbi:hypothetical protein DFH09DRAFT_1078631 [Mycena vulgaris]|nr:hypothetical protein DFH09DRAFT_1078631 [Mycena vulgaris]